MKKIICFPFYSVPSRFDNDAIYFQLFSNVGIQGTKTLPLAASLPDQLRRFGVAPTPEALDFAVFALSVVASDKLIPRDDSPDGWTRMIDLTVPVSAPAKWTSLKPKAEKMLKFLTGDFWKLTFQGADFSAIQHDLKPRVHDGDCVCLLSGGVDSLVGAIDLMSEKRKPLLVSQIIRGDGERQRKLANGLGENIYHQWSIGDIKGPEISTRARSIAFFAFALLSSFALSRSREFSEIVVPENGFISLNVPLSSNRIGSLSTKTTHPVYMNQLQDLWDNLGIGARLVLPYRYKTKGEMLKECRNITLLREMVFDTNSCGKFRRHGYKHCGVCLPCLVRRAAFLESAIQDVTIKGYKYSDIRDCSSIDLNAVVMAIRRVQLFGINRFVSGELSFASLNERRAYVGVVDRGIKELENYLKGYGLV